MTPSYGRTQEQHDNVEKLIAGLKSLPDDYDKFRMTSFAEDDRSAANATAQTGCGTAACIVGHGPSFGVPLNPNERGGVIDLIDAAWVAYSVRAFGIDGHKGSYENNWYFCFSSGWLNSITEAIARLTLAQAGAIPAQWDYDDRFAGEEL